MAASTALTLKRSSAMLVRASAWARICASRPPKRLQTSGMRDAASGMAAGGAAGVSTSALSAGADASSWRLNCAWISAIVMFPTVSCWDGGPAVAAPAALAARVARAALESLEETRTFGILARILLQRDAPPMMPPRRPCDPPMLAEPSFDIFADEMFASSHHQRSLAGSEAVGSK